MKPRDYVVAGQILSARRHGIRLGGPYRYSKAPEERERGEKAWVFELEDNLLEPLTDDARQAFEQADGCELRADSFGEGNMYALHSSSAAGCNLFHRWHRSGQIVPIVKALGIPTIGAEALTFEEKCEIDPHRSRPPKIDVVISYGKGPLRAVGVECKFCEPHGGLDAAYLALDDSWGGLSPVCAHSLEESLLATTASSGSMPRNSSSMGQ